MTLISRIDEVLKLLRKGRQSPLTFKPQYSAYRTEFYKDDNQKLFKILDSISASDGKRKLRSWMQRPDALDLVCEIIGDEMDAVKKVEQLPGLAAITPEFIESWTISDSQELAPSITRILLAVAETPSAKEKNVLKSPVAVCNIMMKQLSYQRSYHSSGFAAQFGLFLCATGCARQTIEALHRCGLCVSYKSIRNNLHSLAQHCMDLAVAVGAGPHVSLLRQYQPQHLDLRGATRTLRTCEGNVRDE
ncbi:hypothetical protein CPB84DRAFT_1799050 [Gymnopilus junonius]|uniref:Uncharacterized protein n=1 Tax=Gymnopilus junonius TaxID=109634 RepID=A0A9P5N8M7_GYMJU|nr:hypothetical protein CPB84DRAFT_1799050 [Gymnopilus junonius]